MAYSDPEKPIIFMHISKTAGSTLYQIFQRNYKRNQMYKLGITKAPQDVDFRKRLKGSKESRFSPIGSESCNWTQPLWIAQSISIRRSVHNCYTTPIERNHFTLQLREKQPTSLLTRQEKSTSPNTREICRSATRKRAEQRNTSSISWRRLRKKTILPTP